MSPPHVVIANDYRKGGNFNDVALSSNSRFIHPYPSLLPVEDVEELQDYSSGNYRS